MAKKITTPEVEKSDKRAEIIIVRHYGDKDFIQLYAEYVADRILESSEEQKSA